MTAEMERDLLCADDPAVTFGQLDAGQEAGEQCVVCWRTEPDVPVGKSRLGTTVYACAEPCARQLGFEARP